MPKPMTLLEYEARREELRQAYAGRIIDGDYRAMDEYIQEVGELDAEYWRANHKEDE